MRQRLTVMAALIVGLLVLSGAHPSFAATRNTPARTRAEASATVTQNLESVAGVSFVNATARVHAAQ